MGPIDGIEDDRIEEHVVDMDNLKEESVPILEGTDAVFITMGVGAPSKVNADTLKKVDFELPAEFVEAAKEADVKHCSVLTSVGADITADGSGKQTYAGCSYIISNYFNT